MLPMLTLPKPMLMLLKLMLMLSSDKLLWQGLIGSNVLECLMTMQCNAELCDCNAMQNDEQWWRPIIAEALLQLLKAGASLRIIGAHLIFVIFFTHEQWRENGLVTICSFVFLYYVFFVLFYFVFSICIFI